MEIPRVPFTILALAPVSEAPEGFSEPRIVGVEIDILDEAVDALAATISVPVPKELCPIGYLSFKPSGMKDFKPQSMVKNISYLISLSDAGEFIDRAGKEGLPEEQIAQRLRNDRPDLPLDLTITRAESTSQKQEKSAIDDILSMVAMPGETDRGAKTQRGGWRAWKGQVDDLLAGLLEKIFANEAFRSMESAWRGIETIVKQGPARQGERIVLKVAPVSQSTLTFAMDHLRSHLAEDLPNLILIDVSFDTSSPSTQLLEKVADFAATLLVPTAVWIGPRFFHLGNWGELKKLPYLKHHLEDMAYAKWRKLKEEPGGDWLVMVANRFLVREPYGADNPPRPVFFREQEPLWISPVWALGALLAQSSVAYGWPTRFTDYRNIALENLAVGPFGGEEAASTETVFSEERIMQFMEAGITPLTGSLRKDNAFVPKEATLSGGPLKFQLFFNQIIGFLFRLKDEIGDAVAQEDLEAYLTSALTELFRGTGHEPPVDLSIHFDQAEEGKPISLRIGLTPPDSILPSSQKLEFSMAW